MYKYLFCMAVSAASVIGIQDVCAGKKDTFPADSRENFRMPPIKKIQKNKTKRSSGIQEIVLNPQDSYGGGNILMEDADVNVHQKLVRKKFLEPMAPMRGHKDRARWKKKIDIIGDWVIIKGQLWHWVYNPESLDNSLDRLRYNTKPGQV